MCPIQTNWGGCTCSDIRAPTPSQGAMLCSPGCPPTPCQPPEGCGKPQRTHHTGEAPGSTPGSRPVSCRLQNKTWTDAGLERPQVPQETRSCASPAEMGPGLREMVSMCCPWISDSSTGERPPRAPLSSSGARLGRLGPRVAARAAQMELWGRIPRAPPPWCLRASLYREGAGPAVVL